MDQHETTPAIIVLGVALGVTVGWAIGTIFIFVYLLANRYISENDSESSA